MRNRAETGLGCGVIAQQGVVITVEGGKRRTKNNG
jgi:hypothetical protein